VRKLGLALAIAVALGTASAGAATRRGPYLHHNTNLYVVSRSGSSIRQITHDHRDHLAAVWSPDGGQIADAVQVGNHDKIEVLTARGRVLRRFEAGEAFGSAPAWSPDGRSIAYVRSYHDVRRDADDGELVVRLIPDGRTRVVTRLATERPVWTPDGGSLLYIRGDIVADEPRLQPSLWRVNFDGSHDHMLVPGKVVDPPAISHDGRRIAYVRERHSGSELWIARSDGRRRRRLLEASYITEQRFAPQGRGVWAFVNDLPHDRTLLFEPSGARRTLPVWASDWSDDGRLLAGLRETRVATIRPDRSHRRVLFRFRLSQRSPTREYAACDALSWAPGGDRLLVACGKDSAD
jgi:Tol biopolymer transport system component